MSLDIDNDASDVAIDGGQNDGIVNVNLIAPKRGRGRPAKRDGDRGNTAGGDTDRAPASNRDRGNRKPAAAAKTKASAVVSVDAVALLVGIAGNFVAAKLKAEALALDDAEAKAIAAAACNVMKQYSVVMDEKTAAWVGLATTIGTIYGVKIAAIRIAQQMGTS